MLPQWMAYDGQVVMLNSPQTESGRELLARLAPRPDLTLMLSELWSKCPVPGDIIEISGPCGSGKTHMVMESVAAALACDTTSGVVLLDTERHLSARRLLQLLERHLPQPGAARAALSRLEFLTATSSHQVLVALEALLWRLQQRAGVLLLAVDSLSAFYWSDRHALAVVGERADSRYRELGRRLVRLARQRRLVVVAARQPLSASAASWDFMGAEWAAAVTRTLRLGPTPDGPPGTLVARADVAGAAGQSWQRRLVIEEAGIRWL